MPKRCAFAQSVFLQKLSFLVLIVIINSRFCYTDENCEMLYWLVMSQRLEITPLFCISRVWLKLNCLLIGNQWISCLLCFCLCVQGVSHWTKTGCEGVQIDIFRNNWRDDLSKTSLQTGICYWFSHGSFSFVSPGWLYWINPTNY